MSCMLAQARLCLLTAFLFLRSQHPLVPGPVLPVVLLRPGALLSAQDSQRTELC